MFAMARRSTAEVGIYIAGQGCSQGVFFTPEALVEFQHVNCMIV